MDKNQEKLKPEYSPETISKEFKDLFAQVCDLTRIKAIKNPAKDTNRPWSSAKLSLPS